MRTGPSATRGRSGLRACTTSSGSTRTWWTRTRPRRTGSGRSSPRRRGRSCAARRSSRTVSPSGCAGTTRAERYALHVPVGCRPRAGASGGPARRPAAPRRRGRVARRTLDRDRRGAVPWLDALDAAGLAWGPVGSVGFELATGRRVATPGERPRPRRPGRLPAGLGARDDRPELARCTRHRTVRRAISGAPCDLGGARGARRRAGRLASRAPRASRGPTTPGRRWPTRRPPPAASTCCSRPRGAPSRGPRRRRTRRRCCCAPPTVPVSSRTPGTVPLRAAARPDARHPVSLAVLFPGQGSQRPGVITALGAAASARRLARRGGSRAGRVRRPVARRARRPGDPRHDDRRPAAAARRRGRRGGRPGVGRGAPGGRRGPLGRRVRGGRRRGRAHGRRGGPGRRGARPGHGGHRRGRALGDARGPGD